MAFAQPGRSGPPDGGVVNRLVHRALVALAHGVPSIQDEIDCADLLVASGYEAEARRLHDLIDLRRGLWPAGPATRDAGRPGGSETFSLEIAIADLSRLMMIAPPVMTCEAGAEGFVLPVLGIAEPDAALLCSALVSTLSRPEGPDTHHALAAILDAIRAEILDRPDTPADLVGQPVSTLVSYAVVAGLRDWTLAHHDLAYAPFGSAALLHAAARCRAGGLGPWLDNVPLLLRTSQDVFALARIAQERAGQPIDDDALERWSGLLALSLDPGMQLDIIDDLGDRGMQRALRQLLSDIIRAPGRALEREMLWRIRDAGIDNGDYDLATGAQRRLATRDPHSRVEWMVLGEVQASGGDYDGAERSLRTALSLEPDDRPTIERLDAVLTRNFAGFAIRTGFGSSRDRILRRTARLERFAAASGKTKS
ncbi:hypothetical protein GCM10011404_22470 [Sphingomonas prati]|nr:hypothetical protein GCM10011404_22470 [Sphingomonas prati]